MAVILAVRRLRKVNLNKLPISKPAHQGAKEIAEQLRDLVLTERTWVKHPHLLTPIQGISLDSLFRSQ